MTTVNYSNVYSITPPEIVFSLLFMMIGTVIFAFVIGEILLILEDVKYGYNLYDKKDSIIFLKAKFKLFTNPLINNSFLGILKLHFIIQHQKFKKTKILN
ncbi:hypothetical protein IMG5_130350 [Ichthyophthirius multifiliis]|uniref:Uncharacterized protein n=1 Tax=Ichthyophthirius multifiliis TaxID=5932 RepID=G0QW98_ICHMU|nr:hypothetical protein IMG5_130350 [Ichthyophthirius multifiliis]EGR30521.1 hypothetical protein IMG5_130350 [Ichthyophthirius multifiliis]|eukprot:XP_004032108.1 hypothetical protein IMG5_130350 [Ichthyophthirius multifiliis]